jgi:hypothetical protein
MIAIDTVSDAKASPSADRSVTLERNSGSMVNR